MDRQFLIGFRKAAAGLIKDLIRARAIRECEFLDLEDYRRWGVQEAIQNESYTCSKLLENVDRAWGRFQVQFLAYPDSSPGEPDEQESTFEELCDLMTAFIQGDLQKAATLVAADETVFWGDLADWTRLSSIRDLLDKLPQERVEIPRHLNKIEEEILHILQDGQSRTAKQIAKEFPKSCDVTYSDSKFTDKIAALVILELVKPSGTRGRGSKGYTITEKGLKLLAQENTEKE